MQAAKSREFQVKVQGGAKREATGKYSARPLSAGEGSWGQALQAVHALHRGRPVPGVSLLSGSAPGQAPLLASR